ncbi:MAG: SMI1/KNR4 family protein [Agriterribacter sp.]
MQKNYIDDILLKLEPYKDKAFYFPSTANEIALIEKQISQKFPEYFKQFLLTFGIRQDFVLELFKREGDIIDNHSYLPQSFKKLFIPIGGSSAGGDTWFIKSSSEDQHIYEYVHETQSELTILDFSFSELIDRNIIDLRDHYESSPFNKDKNWCMQFSIETTKLDLLLKTIGAVQTTEWTNSEVSSAGIYCAYTEIALADKKLKLSRQEYKGWKSPTYYFNWKDPAYKIGAASFIRTLDTKLSKTFKRYTLIDYGIMALSDD